MTAGDRIFLAHAREDRTQVEKLYSELKSRGFKPWLDKFDLIPGQLWKTEIPKAIRQAAVFLACLSTRSIEKRGYYQNEFRVALKAFAERPPRSIYLIPVRLDDCIVPDLEIADLGISLRDFHWVDLWEDGGFDRLITGIKSALDAAHTSTAAPPRRTAVDTLSAPAFVDITAEGRASRSPHHIRSYIDALLMEEPINDNNLENYTKWKYPGLLVDKEIQRLLLSDLDKNRYKTIGDLDAVVDAAWDAVHRYKEEKPEFFKSGTDYLTKSLGFVDEAFRAEHRFSPIPHEAFSSLAHLVRPIG